jgi:hypothetical protein
MEIADECGKPQKRRVFLLDFLALHPLRLLDGFTRLSVKLHGAPAILHGYAADVS